MNVGQFSVGDVQFFRSDGSLTYLPTRTTRLYQVVAGIGLAIAFGSVAVLIYRAKPLGQLVEEGNSLNDIAAIGVGLLALGLLTAIPFYVKQAKRPYVINASPKELATGGRVIRDLSYVVHVKVKLIGGGGSEAAPHYIVQLTLGTKDYSLPLLRFDIESQARRIGEEIGQLLGVQVL